jgi:hypothetical protein
VGEATVTTTLDITSSQLVTVAYTTGDGDATAWRDYAPQTGVLTQGVLTITVPITDDNFDEPNETVVLTLTETSDNAKLGAPHTTTVVITDDDEAKVVVTPIVLTITEPTGADHFTISLKSAPTATVLITLSTSNSQCSVSPTIDIDSSNWMKGVPVPVRAVDDSVDDDNQVCTVQTSKTHSLDKGYDNHPIDNVVVNVRDDDEAGLDVIPLTINVSEDGITETYDVSLTSEPTATVTVAFAYDQQQIVLQPSTELIFTKMEWDQAKTVVVRALDDAIEEGPLTTLITHTTHSDDSNYEGITETVTTTLSDNDVATLHILDTSIIEGNDITKTAVFSVELYPSSTKWVTANYETEVITADVGIDYHAISGTLIFAPEQSTGVITVPVLGDWIDEVTEAFGVRLFDPINAEIGEGRGTCEIIDNDTTGIVLNRANLSISENEINAVSTYTIRLRSKPTADVQITFDPNPDNQIIPPSLRTFTLSNWNQLQPVPIQAIDDSIAESQPHTVTISHLVSSSDLDYDGIRVRDILVTIDENDILPTIQFDKDVYTVMEDEESTSISVVLTPTLTNTVSISYSITGIMAEENEDFTPVSGTLTFTSGASYEYFTVPIIDDNDKECSDEEIRLRLQNPVPAGEVQLGERDWAILKIEDDEPCESHLYTMTVTGDKMVYLPSHDENALAQGYFTAEITPSIHTEFEFTWITQSTSKKSRGWDQSTVQLSWNITGNKTITVTAKPLIGEVPILRAHHDLTVEINQLPTIRPLDTMTGYISPVQPQDTDDLAVRYHFIDDQEETGTLLHWGKNNHPQPFFDNQTTIPAKYTSPGEQWCVEIIPSDGYDYGETITDCVWIDVGDTKGEYIPPHAEKVIIEPSRPVYSKDVDLTVKTKYSSTLDITEVYSEVRWFLEGVYQPQYYNHHTIAQYEETGTSWCVSVRYYYYLDHKKIYGPSSPKGCVVINPEDSYFPSINPEQVLITATHGINGVTLKLDYPDDSPVLIHWYRDGILQPEFDDNNEVSGKYTASGEQWYATLQPYVGSSSDESTGVLVTTKSVLITQANNVPPLIKDLKIIPSVPSPETSLHIIYTYLDANRDPEKNTQVRWYKWYTSELQLQDMYNNLTSLPKGAVKPGERWLAKVWSSDGTMYGKPSTSQVVVVEAEHRNIVPVIQKAYITPHEPGTDKKLALIYEYYDSDGDLEAETEIDWYVGYSPQTMAITSTHNNDTYIPASKLRPGQFWKAIITPHDGKTTGETFETNYVKIEGSTTNYTCPTILKARITPYRPTSNEDITVIYTYFHPDGLKESGTRIIWSRTRDSIKDEMPEYSNVTKIPASEIQPGDIWEVDIIPRSSGQQCNQIFPVNQVVAVNYKPIVETKLRLTTTPIRSYKIEDIEDSVLPYAKHDQQLHIDYSFDDEDKTDDSAVQVWVRWYQDGKHIPQYDNLETLPIEATMMGGEWIAELRVSDGIETSNWVTSDPIVINRPPKAVNVNLWPPAPTEDVNLHIVYRCYDPDDGWCDSAINASHKSIVRWTVNGVYQPVLLNREIISKSLTNVGDEWCAAVQLYDSGIYGPVIKSNCVTILPSEDNIRYPDDLGVTFLNTSSEIYNAYITPHASTNEKLTVNYSVNNTQTLPVQIRWIVDDSERSDLRNQRYISPIHTQVGETWCAEIKLVRNVQSIRTNCVTIMGIDENELTPVTDTSNGISAYPTQRTEECFPFDVSIEEAPPRMNQFIEVVADDEDINFDANDEFRWYNEGEHQNHIDRYLSGVWLHTNNSEFLNNVLTAKVGDRISTTVYYRSDCAPVTTKEEYIVAEEPPKDCVLTIKPTHPNDQDNLCLDVTPKQQVSDIRWYMGDDIVVTEYYTNSWHPNDSDLCVPSHELNNGETWYVTGYCGEHQGWHESAKVEIGYTLFLPYMATRWFPGVLCYLAGAHDVSGNKADTACQLMSGAPYKYGKPEKLDDKDWYFFVTPQKGTITVTLTNYLGEGDMYLKYGELDYDNEKIINFEEKGRDLANSSTTRLINATEQPVGVYFILVESKVITTTAYTIEVNFTPDPSLP